MDSVDARDGNDCILSHGEHSLFSGTSAYDALKLRILEMRGKLLVAVIIYTWDLIIMICV